jgi:hypothetical protein
MRCQARGGSALDAAGFVDGALYRDGVVTGAFLADDGADRGMDDPFKKAS